MTPASALCGAIEGRGGIPHHPPARRPPVTRWPGNARRHPTPPCLLMAFSTTFWQ